MTMQCRKGIILAGGKGSRMFPSTVVVNKHLLPVYDKPMIYYPLSTLMLAGIADILIISDPQFIGQFKFLLGDGAQWGLKISYLVQDEPRGLADAFLIADAFIGNDPVALILGDNIFHGQHLSSLLQDTAQKVSGCRLFGMHVGDPERYGVVELDAAGRPLRFEEKPLRPRSSLAVVGLYFYDGRCVDYAKRLKPSARGELEITDLNRLYLAAGAAQVTTLGRGIMWLDVGLADALAEATNYVRTVQQRQGMMLSCPEEVAVNMGYITVGQLAELVRQMPGNEYSEYLRNLLQTDE